MLVRYSDLGRLLAVVAAVLLAVEAHSAEKEAEWRLGRQGDKVNRATTPYGNLTVYPKGVSRIQFAWPDALQHLQGLSVRVILRTGRMYHLYGLNELRDTTPIDSTDTYSNLQGSNLVVVSEGEAPGVRITNEMAVYADGSGFRLKLKLIGTETAGNKLFGPKFQIQYQVHYNKRNDPRNVVLALPTPRRFTVLRAYDATDQEIRGQDGHRFFPMTARLAHPWGILVSTEDRKGLCFNGSNLQYVTARLSPRYRLFYFYGKDVALDKGEEHVETVTFRLAQGVGGISSDINETLSGKGALLEKRYVVNDRKIPVHFTCPGSDFRSEVRVIGGDEKKLEQSGNGDIMLDVSDLSDGTYTVVKTLRTVNGTFTGEEQLRVLRATYEGFDKEVADLDAFAQIFDCAGYEDPKVARIRIGLINFKLEDVEFYRQFHEVDQVRGLLDDAARAAAALKKGEPASMPVRAEMIYSHNLSEDPGDFLVFGNGDITFSPERGMYLEPVGTMNLWTRFQVSGSYMVEFDYFPMSERAMGTGGTMLQLSGNPVNPVCHYSFMPSASWGSMTYYMFGIKCYHFSFSRGGGEGRPRISNFRKTGKGFYVLSRIADPITDLEKWYHLSFAKVGNHFMFFVDGELVQEYIDEGNQGPFLDSGHIGIRNWTLYRSCFRNFQVHRIIAAQD